MDRSDDASRRAVLGMVGTSVGTALAGCLGGERDARAEPVDEDAWADVHEISLTGHSTGWTGVAPAVIEGVQNPTLGLVAGRQYALTWENVDGGFHNVELRDREDDVRHGTDPMADRGETQTLEFRATPELVVYLCRPHRNSMVGRVAVFEA